VTTIDVTETTTTTTNNNNNNVDTNNNTVSILLAKGDGNFTQRLVTPQ
jgi:hypothetical protein